MRTKLTLLLLSLVSTVTGKSPDYWAVEDPKVREKLPLYKTIPAAKPEEMTPAVKWPKKQDFIDWRRSQGDATSSRYSLLDQINLENISDLETAWIYRSEDGKANVQANPIVVQGVLITPTPGKRMVGLDAATGKELWNFRNEKGGQPAFRGMVHWEGNEKHEGRILFTAGETLYALRPKDGKVLFAKPGPEVRAAGAIFKNVLVLAGFRKDVFGFDIRTGEKLWTFHTIPEEGEFGHDTWDRPENGANCWGGMSLDAHRGIAYVSTGSPKPNFLGHTHHGLNLFANCVIAIDAVTGKRIWHFQEIRHDIWDLDIPCAPNLVTVTRNGRKIDAVAQVTKMGNTLVLDRVTGKPLFPFRLKRAPTSPTPGELTSPYQPAPELPEPFIRQVFTSDEVPDRSPEARAHVLKRTEGMRFGFYETHGPGMPIVMLPGTHGGAEWTGACFDPESELLYVSATELPSIVKITRTDRAVVDETQLTSTPGRKVYETFCIACHGPNRQGVGVAPSIVGLSSRLKDQDVRDLIPKGRGSMPPLPVLDKKQTDELIEYLFDRDREYPKPLTRPERPSYGFGGFPKLFDHEGYPGIKPPWGILAAIDLNSGRLAWKIPYGEYEELTAQGMPLTGTRNFGGPLVTKGGLVFCSGTADNKIRAFDKTSGKELWSARLPYVGSAPPATYGINGRQYIVVPATGNVRVTPTKGDAWVAFALPRK
ncbi:MAG: PQQ-binding-like beta-propeller repeat protein [Opitutae bacterium]|nr:PQQ-binding-like beta-propeller repeat protein [Opitutae bacterium]